MWYRRHIQSQVNHEEVRYLPEVIRQLPEEVKHLSMLYHRHLQVNHKVKLLKQVPIMELDFIHLTIHLHPAQIKMNPLPLHFITEEDKEINI